MGRVCQRDSRRLHYAVEFFSYMEQFENRGNVRFDELCRLMRLSFEALSTLRETMERAEMRAD
jgi:hypothetical protein